MKTALSFIAGASLLALVSSAGAQEPIKLSELQMEGVTAGASVSLLATANAQSGGQALANLLGAATVKTETVADPIGATSNPIGVPYAYAAGTSTVVASSVLGIGFVLPNAVASSASVAVAALQ